MSDKRELALSILDLEKKISSGQPVLPQNQVTSKPVATGPSFRFSNPVLVFWQHFFFDVNDNVQKSPKIHLPSLALMGFMSVVVMMTGMIVVQLPDWLTGIAHAEGPAMLYQFQIPLAVFTGAFLGPILGTAAIAIYLLTGLFVLPVFAGGGGLEYLTNPGFGFLAGMMLSAFYAGFYIRQIYKNKMPFLCSLRILGVGFFAVLLAHLTGIITLAGLTISGVISFEALQHWIVQYSLKPLPYDVLAALTFMTCVRYSRIFLYPALY